MDALGSRVQPVAQARHALAGGDLPLHHLVRGVLIGLALTDQGEARVEQVHARLDVAAVIRPEAEDAGRDRSA